MLRHLQLTDMESVNAIVSKLRIFGGVTDGQREMLFQKLELWRLQESECIFCKGDEPAAIYVVKSGKVDIQIRRGDVTIKKHELQVGESFGEASMMSMHCHTATAVAAVESEVLVLSRRALIQLKHEDLELFALLMMNLARELARRLYLTDQMLLEATSQNAKLV